LLFTFHLKSGGDRAVFDVTIKKPMGIVLEYLPDKKGPSRSA
jgi:hypothetical protein